MHEDLRKVKRQFFGRTGCDVPGCTGRHKSRGFCRKHYERFMRNGTTELRMAGKGEGLEWLQQHIDFSGDECLIWPFHKSKDGYAGAVAIDGKYIKAYAFMLSRSVGPRPEGLEALHSCGNGSGGCVNPKHLRWGTSKENANDRIAHGRSQRGEIHYKSKLTKQSVVEIKAKLKDYRYTHAELAHVYGVSKKTISGIARGRVWGWLQVDGGQGK